MAAVNGHSVGGALVSQSAARCEFELGQDARGGFDAAVAALHGGKHANCNRRRLLVALGAFLRRA